MGEWPSQIPARTSKKIALIDLNDDCLVSIFRQLSLMDSNSVGLSCHRLHEVVVDGIYRYQAKMINIDITRMVQRLSYQNNLEHRIECLREYLQRFGHLIEHIDFDSKSAHLPSEFVQDILSFIIMYTSNRFQSLNVANVILDDDSSVKLHGILNRLTKLEISDNWTTVFSACPDLDTLKINYFTIDRPFNLNYTFPKLKIFHFKCFTPYQEKHKLSPETKQQISDQTSSALANFLKRHTNLASLTITSTFARIDGIGNLRNLEELQLSSAISVTNTVSLYNLSKLRKIHITNAEIYSQFLQKSVSVESLVHITIGECTIDESFIYGLGRFRYLRYLLFRINFFQKYIELSDEIWEQLQNINSLTELHIDFASNSKYADKFMINLIQNNLKLRNLSLMSGVLPPELFVNLTKLENLDSLCFNMCFNLDDNVRLTVIDGEISIVGIQDQIDWKSLKQLNKIKQLVLVGNWSLNRYIPRFLTELGSHNTLEVLEIRQFHSYDKIYHSIRDYPNLATLRLSAPTKHFEFSHLNMIFNLKRLTHFSVRGVKNDFTNQDIIDLVERFPTLESLAWKTCPTPYVRSKVVSLNMELYGQLVNVVSNRFDNHKLKVDIIPNLIKVPHHTQKYVEICSNLSESSASSPLIYW